MFRTFLSVFVLGIMAVAAAAQAEPRTAVEPRTFSFFVGGDGGYLGINTAEVSAENYSSFGLSRVRGVAVEKVVEGSPAARAGLQARDVIVRLNGDEITSTRKLSRLVAEIAPDHTARLTVVRGGAEIDVEVTLGKRPAPQFGDAGMFGNLEGLRDFPIPPAAPQAPGAPQAPAAPMIWSMGTRRQIGVSIVSLSDQLAAHYGVENGLLVNTVRENSPAAKAGLRAGDIIVEADGKSVAQEGALVRALAEKKEGDISITYLRGQERRTVSVTPEEVKGGGATFFEFPGAPLTPSAPDAPGLLQLKRPATTLGRFVIPGRII